MTSTLVSFSKTGIREVLPGMQIANYSLDAGGKEGIVLHVQDSHYYKPDLDGKQDRVFVPSAQIAESLVRMHITSQLEYKELEQHPAVFAIPDRELTVEQVKKEFAQKILEALKCQRKWYIALVRIADDDWARLKRHSMISEVQRIAARELGLKREWLVVTDEETKLGCPFCGTNLLDPEAPICPTCGKVHNPQRLKDIELKLGVTAVKEPPTKQ